MTAKREFNNSALKLSAAQLLDYSALMPSRITMRDFNQACIDSMDELQSVEITAYNRRPLSK